MAASGTFSFLVCGRVNNFIRTAGFRPSSVGPRIAKEVLRDYQPPPVEQARSITFSRMVRTMDAMMLNMHPVVRTCIAMRGSVAVIWIRIGSRGSGQQPCPCDREPQLFHWFSYHSSLSCSVELKSLS